MNIVADTNVLLSGVLWKGPSFEALKAILESYTLVQSQSTLEEFGKVIRREKFTRILQRRGLSVDPIVEALILQSKIYTVTKISKSMAKKVKIRDADDLIFVELAIESNAKFIVSGDKHLLDLQKVEHIDILSVNELLKYLRENK
jgi:putative PIN family toxin of toxin-antitoxin system